MPDGVDFLDLPAPIGRVRLRRMARARRLTLRLRQETGEIALTAPLHASKSDIEAFLVGQTDWVAARRAKLPEEIWPAPGLSLPILGAEIRLVPGKKLLRDGDVLALPGEGAGFRAALKAYLRETARAEFTRLSDHYAAQLGVGYKRLTLRDTRSRWGSCTSQGGLMYSWRLVLAPRAVLAYVAAHEVAHLREMNHGAGFWALVEQISPEFRVHRAWLRAEGGTLLRYRFE